MSVGDISWMSDGACQQHFGDLWFPEGKGHQAPEAKLICLGRASKGLHSAIPPCPVLEQCRAYAIPRTDLDGVWAGMTERDRKNARAAANRAGREAA